MSNNKDFILKNAVEVGGPTNVTLGTITGNAINLSTGNYFNDTLTANTTYTISNAGDVQAFQLEVTGGTVLTDTWDISTAVYSQNYSIGYSEGLPEDIFFGSNGIYMYVIGDSNNRVYRYTLTTAWDISTVSTSNYFAVGSRQTEPKGLFFKSDGTKMYVLGNINQNVDEYNLSTAWDVSTASFNQAFSVGSQDTQPKSLSFKGDGTKMYVLGGSGEDINEYNLTTAWDISTASFLQNKSISTNSGTPTGIFFKPDGSKVYVTSDSNNDVDEYNLSTAWDISTASYSQDFSVSTQETAPNGLFFKDDGTNMYVIGDSGDDVNQYTIGSSSDATLTWPSSIEWAGGTAPSASASGETDVFTFVTDDSGTSYVGLKTAENLS